MRPRTFELVRYRDLSGVSGTGVVAEGCVFTDGSVALRWRGNNPATAVWPDVESVLAVHGHQGATEVRWLEDELSAAYASTDTDGLAAPAAWSEPAGDTASDAGFDLEQLFGGQHNVRPPSSMADPSALPPSRARGWAGARHLR
ncbi:hypothetical protein [Kribbella catacumbae]|uniref:hypothetical protein n=1 Tax=Kribbella catacumbae TaxID=460086 RepID=UPI0003655053|nr:hypothetical protein [Kribbella catacumbae]